MKFHHRPGQTGCVVRRPGSAADHGGGLACGATGGDVIPGDPEWPPDPGCRRWRSPVSPATVPIRRIGASGTPTTSTSHGR